MIGKGGFLADTVDAMISDLKLGAMVSPDKYAELAVRALLDAWTGQIDRRDGRSRVLAIVGGHRSVADDQEHRVRNPARGFLMLQAAIPVYAALSLAAFLFAGLVIWMLGRSPVSAFRVYVLDPLTDPWSLQEMVIKATPLALRL